MATQISSLEKYQFKETDRILIDANIWLFLFGINKPKDKKIDLYSSALDKIIKVKSKLYIESLIISEFINTYARIAFNISDSKTKNLNFKAYRKTPEFKPVAKDISYNIKKILSLCQFMGDCYLNDMINQIVLEFSNGNSDFNDQVFVEICKRRNLIILTDDGDFKNSGIHIITANRKLLEI